MIKSNCFSDVRLDHWAPGVGGRLLHHRRHHPGLGRHMAGGESVEEDCHCASLSGKMIWTAEWMFRPPRFWCQSCQRKVGSYRPRREITSLNTGAPPKKRRIKNPNFKFQDIWQRGEARKCANGATSEVSFLLLLQNLEVLLFRVKWCFVKFV